MLINLFLSLAYGLAYCATQFLIFRTPSVFIFVPVLAVIHFIPNERKRKQREREALNEKWQKIYEEHPFIRESALKHPNDFPVAPIDKEN